jgi:hypothetical protein
MTEQMPNPGHSRHRLPFSAILEQVCESLNGPEMRGHASPFENERI